MDTLRLDSVEDAIEDIKNGKLVIVVDDEDRENEGDFIAAAEKVTPEMVNFMITHARGYLCVALTENRCDELGLDLMVGKNTDPMKTAFTVTVDLDGFGCTTGISVTDRAKTINALSGKDFKAENFRRPGHINPLKAKDGGVLRRAGHTEAAIDLARLSGCQPAGSLIEILNEDGSCARLPQLRVIADRFQLKLISIMDLINYRLKHDSLIKKEVSVKMPTEFGDFQLHSFTQTNTGEVHLALVKGEWEENEPVLVRVHSSCVTGDIFGSCRCDCGQQLHEAMKIVEKEGKGVVLYMNQEGRGIGLLNKLKTYELQEKGYDTVEANVQLGFKPDERDYGVGAQILRALKISKIRLISNNPTKRAALLGYGLEIVERVPLEIPANPHNQKYLHTKKEKMGHELKG